MAASACSCYALKMPKSAKTPSVADYLSELNHPRRAEIDQLRGLIQSLDTSLQESIKWNAPSFEFKTEHVITFRLQPGHRVQLVLHTGVKKRPEPLKLEILDPEKLLEWAAPDRAVITVQNQADLDAKAQSIRHLISQWLEQLSGKL